MALAAAPFLLIIIKTQKTLKTLVCGSKPRRQMQEAAAAAAAAEQHAHPGPCQDQKTSLAILRY